jgi:hypothetical protein
MVKSSKDSDLSKNFEPGVLEENILNSSGMKRKPKSVDDASEAKIN